MKVLFVEDEAPLRTQAVSKLRSGGLVVDPAVDLGEASSAVAIFDYAAILLDRYLPDGDGLGFLRDLRARRDHTPVILMSAQRVSVRDRIEGLDCGADDYLCKPLPYDEVAARVRSVLRRPRGIAAQGVKVGNLAFDLDRREVAVDGALVRMARREVTLLECLARNLGHVVGREQIEAEIYGIDEEVSMNAVDVLLHRVRAVLERHGSTARIRTMRGLGYTLHDADPRGDA